MAYERPYKGSISRAEFEQRFGLAIDHAHRVLFAIEDIRFRYAKGFKPHSRSRLGFSFKHGAEPIGRPNVDVAEFAWDNCLAVFIPCLLKFVAFCELC